MAAAPGARSLEREAKLRAPDGFALPDLSGVVDGAVAVEMATRQLDAMYYDTTDLRLARWGITLRHRRGEPGPPWTLKLPQSEDGPALSRQEIGFEGPEGEVPDAAVDLVSAVARGRRLGPVARLSTTRHPLRVSGRDGRPLAEVVDDAVSASSTEHQVQDFREIEIEVYQDGADTTRLLRRAIRRLTDAGCEVQPPVPKLVRALGARAARPADVTLSPLRAKPSLGEALEHSIARSVTQILCHDPGVRLGGDPEDVHQLRVAARRLRSDLRTFRPVLDRSRVDCIRQELRWLGKRVGAVRDLDVLAMRLHATADCLPDPDHQPADMLLRHLEDENRSARDLMLAAMRSARYLRLLDDLVALAASPPLIDEGRARGPRARREAARWVRKSWKALARAVHDLADEPPDADLHHVRILAKRSRYAAEAVAPVLKSRARVFADAIADVQTILGDHQDTVVLEAWLRKTADAVPESAVAAGELIALERRRRQQLRDRWPAVWKRSSARRLRRWM